MATMAKSQQLIQLPRGVEGAPKFGLSLDAFQGHTQKTA